MKRVLASIAAVICTCTNISAATDGEKMMFAAAIVVGAAYPVSGDLTIESDERATMRSYDRQDRSVVFERVSSCVYAVRVETRGSSETGYAVVDFRRLGNTWKRMAGDLFFPGEAQTACFRDPRLGRAGCSTGLLITKRSDLDRIIDDVAYLSRHGCGGGDPDPR